MDDAVQRREWRQRHVDQLVATIGVARDALASSTQQCLEEWARQVYLVLNQPSANWGKAVLDLCRAVESELASRLGSISGLEFFADPIPLGAKAKRLRDARLDASVEQKLSSRGVKPGFVSSSLAEKLFKLAAMRSDSDSAHGGVQIRSATENDACKASQLAVEILREIVPTSQNGSQ